MTVSGVYSTTVFIATLNHSLKRSSARHRRLWKRHNLQLSAVQQDRIAQNMDLVQRIAVLAFDNPQPVHELVIEELDCTIEEGGFEFLAASASAPAMGQVSSGQRIPVYREIGRHALELHPAALLPWRPAPDRYPVHPGDHVQIVLDDDDRGAGVDQPVETKLGYRRSIAECVT
jgi:hypothetical protein